MGGLRTPESTEKQHDFEQLLVFVEIHHNIILYTVTDVHNLRDGRTLPNFSSHDHFKTDKTKGIPLFQLFSIYVKDKQQNGNNTSSFKMFMHLN